MKLKLAGKDISPKMQLINQHLAKIAKLSGDDVLLYIGIGRRENIEGVIGMDCQVIGVNVRAAQVGEKLISLVAPTIRDFLQNDFTQWAKDQNVDDWAAAEEKAGTLVKIGQAEDSKTKAKMPYIPPDKARA